MKIEHRVFLLSVTLGVLVGVIDAYLDFLFFYEGTFLELLIFAVPPHEAYIRLVIIACFIIFGLVIGRVMGQKEWAAEHSNYLHSVLMAIRNVNKLIATETNPDKLLQMACETLIETRGYNHSFVVLLDAENRITGSASAGLGVEFQRMLEMIGRGGQVECIIKAKEQSGVLVFDDPPLEHTECPLSMLCHDRIALSRRLESHGAVYGVLAVAASKGLTGEEEMSLFNEVANDLAFALYRFDIEDSASRAHLDLLASESKYHELYNNVRVGLLSSSMVDGRILECNNFFIQMFGFESREHALSEGMTTERYVDPSVRTRIVLELKERGTYDGELALMDVDGNVVWVMVHSRFDEQHDIIESVLENITERKRAEGELRRERNHAQKYLNIAGVMLVSIDSDYKVKLINQKGCELLGYDIEEIIGRDWFKNFIPERIRDEISGVFSRVMRGEIESAEYFENPVLTKNGEERVIAWHNSILTDKAGGIIGTLSSGEDITERLRVEKALRASEKKHRTLIESLMDLVFVYDYRDNISEYYAAQEHLLYTPPEQFMGRHVASVLPSDVAKLHIQHIHEVRTTGTPSTFDYSLEISGQLHWFSAILSLHEDKKSVISVVRDITERKKAEENLKTLTETAMLYLDLMGHDIRNHLQAIVMGTEILGHYDLGPEIEPVLDLIVESVYNSQNLIRKVHDMRGLSSAPLIERSLKDALEESLGVLGETYPDVQVFMECDVQRPIIRADQYLQNLLMNLLDNAVVYNNKKTRQIWVELIEVDEGYEISIADNGAGIPDEKKDILFDPDRRFGGVGVHQVRRIVQKYGGKLSVHDRIDGDIEQGAKFRIWVPKTRN